eukprot:6180838-Pleurochrysis_carterae.AAC.7
MAFARGSWPRCLLHSIATGNCAMLLPDNYEAIQEKIQDLTPDEMFKKARAEVKMHDYKTNRACAVGDGWQAYCDTMKGKYDAFIAAACDLVEEARNSTPMRARPLV